MTATCPPGTLPIAHGRTCYSPKRRWRVCAVTRTMLWVCIVGTLIISLSSILLYTRPGLSPFRAISTRLGWSGKAAPAENSTVLAGEDVARFNDTRRANAVILMLVRNSELENAVASVKELEERFNKHYGYSWLFLNEVPFTDEFKGNMSSVVSGSLSFGLIPPEHWYQPEWIDEEKATASRNQMVADNVIYGGSVSYRNMCRFNSGFFYHHPLVQKYKWYWRVEPGVHFTCNIESDPFVYMEDNNKIYGWTISPHEWPKTVTTLWDAVKEFVDQNPQYVAANNSMNYLSADGGNTYNMCHFWSNFEIANMEFWRGEAYSKFFDHLESKGGFYYERWGDAPVHSIGAGLFAPKDQIHFFDNIGYQHDPLQHCPRNAAVRRAMKCSCKPFRSYDYRGESCLRKWERVMKTP